MDPVYGSSVPLSSGFYSDQNSLVEEIPADLIHQYVPSYGLGEYLFDCDFSESGEPRLTLREFTPFDASFQHADYIHYSDEAFPNNQLYPESNSKNLDTSMDDLPLIGAVPGSHIDIGASISHPQGYFTATESLNPVLQGQTGTVSSAPVVSTNTSNSHRYSCEVCGKAFSTNSDKK